MYGGLFGDLPAAKGDKGSSTTSHDGPQSIGGSSATDPEKQQLQQQQVVLRPEDDSKGGFNDVSAVVVGHMPPTMKKTKTGLAKSIGTAGTSMAFVPTTIKRKKAVTSTTHKPFVSVVKPDTTTTTTTTTTTDSSSIIANASTTQFTLTTIVETVPPQLGPVDIHAPQQSLEDSSAEFPLHVTERLNHHSLINNIDETYEEDEEEPISDPYDPYVPNDLLQYWDREAKKEEQRQLEAETQRAVEQQALLRKRLEEERQELLQRQQQRQQQQGNGSLERLETTGRGRGVSNLPAWLVAAQHEKQRPPPQQDRLGENA
jgi:hypothetical protein